MSYFAHIVDMPAPAEFYDAIHREMISRTDGNLQGLLTHIGRRTDAGFQVIEVWADRESCDRADREVVAPIIASLADSLPSRPSAGKAPYVEQFTPRGLVLPRGGIIL